jgi:hypothetical protein
MYEIPEAEPPLLRCPNCMTTIQKPEPKSKNKTEGEGRGK